MPYGQARPTSGQGDTGHDTFAQTYTEATYTGSSRAGLPSVAIRDWNTDLMYYGARFFDPYLGRFVSHDSAIPNPGNPQSLNRYSYAANNPLRYTDPTGHYEFEEDPDDRWVYSDPQVRSAQDYTAPEYAQGQPSDAEIGGTLVGVFGVVVAGAGASVVAEAAIEIGTAAVTMVGPSIVSAGQTTWARITEALRVASADGDATNEPRVFWTGGAQLAGKVVQKWAAAHRAVTLEMSEAGQLMEKTAEGMPWGQAKPLWTAISCEFAATATGEVHVF